MKNTFMEAVKNRRSYYGIGKDVVASDERIEEIVRDAVRYTPSAFNSQSTRVLILLGEQHNAFWEIAREELRKVVPAASFAPTAEKINSFANGYGTILFFEDTTVVEGLQKQFPLYQEHFPVWSQHTSAMHQLVVWTALEAEGFGASLQHYAPLVDAAVQAKWNVPANWKLIAQMPFGKPTAEPGDKEMNPLEERVKVYK
ncbi:MAG: nitroreductase family protein [Sporomusaceae bacterium]|nr:nitroreductase family protein [Sporomusaceae bacterium]